MYKDKKDRWKQEMGDMASHYNNKIRYAINYRRSTWYFDLSPYAAQPWLDMQEVAKTEIAIRVTKMMTAFFIFLTVRFIVTDQLNANIRLLSELTAFLNRYCVKLLTTQSL